MQYAATVADPAFGTEFTAFMGLYLKQKYAGQPLNTREQQATASFLEPFLSAVRKQISGRQQLKGFLNPARTLNYFVQPEEDQGAIT